MEAIERAGIPIFAIQGPRGGYGILESYKLDRQLMSVDDFYYIITALKGVASSLSDERIDNTLEKMQTLLPEKRLDLFSERNKKLSIDFSMLGGDRRHREIYKVVAKAVETERLLRFSYTNTKLETITRTVEPMTIAFRWHAWYLYGWCTYKEDYRLFRISRIKDPQILAARFRRKERSFETFLETNNPSSVDGSVELVLKFDPSVRAMVEEYYQEEECTVLPDDGLKVVTRVPEDGWLYGYLLSFGRFVEVLEPQHIRSIIAKSAEKIAELYR